ncbi:hypothetical protein ACFSRY_08555 [Pontibacter locisalis]|uniref:Outer membrane protein beta-barrel domain-containing protein n=1 Tax=Pontibacter locisalis TaxID=1719035 RepID=A0ABW5IKG7_9BACT
MSLFFLWGRFVTGLGYGGSKDNLEWSLNHRDTDTIKYSASSKTHVLAVPLTAQAILFKDFKRFPIYGTGSAVTAIGSTKAELSETLHGVITSRDIRESGVNNLFVTAGVGFNYRVSERFNGYVEWFAFKTNLKD